MPIGHTYTKVGSSWRVSWSGVGPYDVWDLDRAQKLVDGLSVTEYLVQDWGDTIEPPPVEVLDLNSEASSVATLVSKPATATLQWWRQLGVDYYLVEQLISAVWTEIGRVAELGRVGYHAFTTGALADVTTHSFRVTPVQVIEEGATVRTVSGLARQIDLFLVRRPPVPLVTRSYDGGTGNLTVAAR